MARQPDQKDSRSYLEANQQAAPPRVWAVAGVLVALFVLGIGLYDVLR
ncbi:hypothetical protein [Roseobacter sp. A03A-229]